MPATQPSEVTPALVKWSMSLTYKDLPAPVVHEAKRYIADSLGCAVAGWTSNKGRRAATAMMAVGGAPDARIAGSSFTGGVPSVAFANAELMNALDFDAIPHTPPVTLPTILAFAEQRGVSGQDLILGAVIGHEVAARMSAASSQMAAALLKTGSTPDVFGINTESGFGGVLGSARIAGLNAMQAAHAFGLSGYVCPPQMSHNWELLRHKTNVKYNPVGWVCQASATAVLLAEQGFTSSDDVFATPAGFDKFYGWQAFQPDQAISGLGDRWAMLGVDFKPYAACRFIHSQIDAMRALQAKHTVRADEIVKIKTWGVPFTAHPDPYDVREAEDAQFSTPYMISLAALGVPIDATAQDLSCRNNPVVRATMQKVEWGVHLDAAAAKMKDKRSYIARVELTTRAGDTFVEERLFPMGVGSLPQSRLSDEALLAKLKGNLSLRLNKEAVERAVDGLWSLDSRTDARKVMSLLSA